MTAILCLGYLAGVSIVIAALTARYLRERLRALLLARLSHSPSQSSVRTRIGQ